MTDNNEPTPTELSKQAFSVYCDYILRDAVEKNEQLKAQNASMEATRDLLLHMKLYKGRDEILKLNLQKPVNLHELNDSLTRNVTYAIDDARIELPYADIPFLFANLSNVRPEGGNGGGFPQLIVHDDETVDLQFFLNYDVSIVAKVTHFTGTVQQVREMSISGRFSLQHAVMGMLDAITGQPTLLGNMTDNSLDGAVVTLKEISITKDLIHPIILKNMDDVVDNCLDFEDDELLVLAQSNPKNDGLFEAANDRKALKAHNLLLKESREVFKTITGHSPDKTVHFQLPIEQGTIRRTTFEDESAWVIEPKGDIRQGLATIQFGAIAGMQLRLANIFWNVTPRPPTEARPHLLPNGVVNFEYSPHICAVYGLDGVTEEIVNNFRAAGNVNFVQHLLTALTSSEPYEGPHFTVKLLALHFRLTTIQSHLDALGIDTSSGSDDE